MVDLAPRVILDRDLGVVTIGRSAQEAAIALDVYEHTIETILRARALGGYRALPASDIFALEYWDLEPAKLRRPPSPVPFSRRPPSVLLPPSLVSSPPPRTCSP